MYPLHDKDLDRLSRDAAEHYEVDFGPSGWEQLEKRLDQELPQDKGKRRRFLFWLFFIVVTSGSALTGLLINSQPVTPLASNHMRAVAPAQGSPAQLNKPATGKVSGKNEAPGPLQQNTAEIPATTDAKQSVVAGAQTVTGDAFVTDKPDRVHNNDAGSTIPVVTDNANKITEDANKKGQGLKISRTTTVTRDRVSNNKLNAPTVGWNKKANNLSRTRKKSTGNNDKNDAGDKGLTNTSGKTIPATQGPVANSTDPAIDEPAGVSNTTPVPDEKAAAPIVNQPIPAADSAATPAVAQKPKDNKSPKDQDRGFEFGLTAGPDASMVEFGPLYKAGYNVGVQIGYRISDRWSVNTGVIYTKRFYKATGDQFTAPKRSPQSYRNIDKLEGYCAMLDIPVNVRYNFVYSDKRRFFASVGASSYLMNDQYYDYWYWPSTGGYEPDNWGSKKADNYFFSVLNLSVGYERTISKRLSIQVEPYLKVPLTGLGYGSMKMGSYGMFFSLKYRPTFGSRK